METLIPFDTEIIGWHLRGWIDVEIDVNRYECVVTEITINQIDRMTLPHSTYLNMELLPKDDQRRIQEFVDQYVDENFHDICRDHAESMKADRDDDY